MTRAQQVMRAFHGQGALTAEQIVERMQAAGVDVGRGSQIAPLLHHLVQRGWLRALGWTHWITPRAATWLPR